ncbi:MAG TPA: type II secretion system minor pseudopilin GspJ [Usitatibacter sp.]|nr:type II secretion system minor pseudopilin GspJ [Usitatibacter sp.]
MSPSNVIGPPPSRGRPRAAVGFTLVELLVALAIFAIMSGFAYRGLTAMLESREALQKESRKWRDVSLLVGRLERDLAAALPRRALGSSGTPLAPMSSLIEGPSSAQGLALTRAGNALLESTLSAPQRVAWRVREGRIERLSWAGVDAAPREEPVATPLLGSVAALTFRYLDPKSLEWRPTWGLPGTDEKLPAAVEATLALASGERIVRVVDMPRNP